jgi:hypothetical protein
MERNSWIEKFVGSMLNFESQSNRILKIVRRLNRVQIPKFLRYERGVGVDAKGRKRCGVCESESLVPHGRAPLQTEHALPGTDTRES